MRSIVLIIMLFSFSRALSQADTIYGYVDSITFRQTEIPPMFVFGGGAWQKFLELNIESIGIPGIVIVEFTIEKNGNSPKDIKIYKSDNPELNNEAKRLIKKTRWVPAIQYGKVVTYRLRQEILFK